MPKKRSGPSSQPMAKLLAFPKPTPRAEEKEDARRERMDKLREIRIAVMKRAQGQCEAPDCHNRTLDLSLDHFMGGSGRRRQMESVENCWALCAKCDAARTANYPNAATWNSLFRVHCKRHGYPVLSHKELDL